MVTYGIMGAIALALLGCVGIGARYLPEGNDGFFDIENTKVLRGVCAVIVVLVHTPASYQNKIQDIISSFGFVAVTFFFMTSAYGLTLSFNNSEKAINSYWQKRLPKLLIPNWLVNISFCLIAIFAFNKHRTALDFFSIAVWVRWLLMCYFAIWIAHIVTKKVKVQNILSIAFVVSISVAFYVLKAKDIVTSTTWCTEVLGFAWGIILASKYDKIKKLFNNKWMVKLGLLLAASAVIGAVYLKYKSVAFLGDYLLKMVLGVVLLTTLLALNSKIRIGNKIGGFLGEISYEIFLSHGMVFSIMSRLVSQLNSGVFILVSLLVTIAFATMIHHISKGIFKCVYKK